MTESQKKYKYGFVVGRFNMLHVGHEYVINTAKEQCENLLILVGSAQEFGTVRNPFDISTRLEMIKTLYGDVSNVYIGFLNDYTNENDHSHEWGRYLLAHVKSWGRYHGIYDPLDAMIYGNDEERNSWFHLKDIQSVNQMQIDRADIPISATQMRGYIRSNNYDLWAKNANPLLHNYFEKLQKQLYEVK